MRAAARTVAPSDASRLAIASPIPREAPVTRATRPSKRFMAAESIFADLVRHPEERSDEGRLTAAAG